MLLAALLNEPPKDTVAGLHDHLSGHRYVQMLGGCQGAQAPIVWLPEEFKDELGRPGCGECEDGLTLGGRSVAPNGRECSDMAPLDLCTLPSRMLRLREWGSVGDLQCSQDAGNGDVGRLLGRRTLRQGSVHGQIAAAEHAWHVGRRQLDAVEGRPGHARGLAMLAGHQGSIPAPTHP